MIASPTLTLMNLKVLPLFRLLFEETLRLGRVKKENNRDIFYFSEAGARATFGSYNRLAPTRVLFGYGANPDSLESATLKAVWLDEAGQDDFRAGSYEAIRRRLSLSRGRILVTTTPFNLGWLKQELYDRAVAGDPQIDLVNFDSLANPAFPREEYAERMRDMPTWRFNMMYRGLFERPGGLIYDCFDPVLHVVPQAFSEKIEDHWPRYLGLDFGLLNFSALIAARDPSSGRFYVYREYPQAGEKDEASGEFAMSEHVKRLMAMIPDLVEGGKPRITTVGGAYSEDVWRREVSGAGLRVARPDQNDIEVGITRVYAAIKRGQVQFLSGCIETLDELARYSRVLDPDTQLPTEAIKDKHSFHFLDCLRYLIGPQMRHAERQRARPIHRRVSMR